MLASVTSEKTNSSGIPEARVLEDSVWTSLRNNEIRQAVRDCQRLNQRHPHYAPGWHTASLIALQLSQPKTALATIEKALAAEPGNVDWQLQHATCLMKLARIPELQALLGTLGKAELRTAYQCSAMGMLLSQIGERECAVPWYEKALAVEPDEPKHHFNLACLLRTLGRVVDAEEHFDQAVRLDPQEYEAYKLRSDLRRQTAERNHVDELHRLLKDGVDDRRGKAHVCFALAKELEDLEQYERSFDYLSQGAGIRRSLMRYDVKRDLETIAAIRETFDARVFETATGGCDNPEAIFVLGMPRTGTTLVERILDSHSEVFAAGELNNFALQLTAALRERNSGQKLARDEMVALSASLDFEGLGKAYVRSTRPFTGHSARFVDKMPLNYLYVGLIHLALPRAKIVNLRRNPMDTCYAVYKQLFVDAYPFSYDLQELAQYYVAYRQLMDHWDAVLPGIVHTVRYEDLVADVKGESRRLLDFCELEWQAQVLNFYENTAASTTASTAQIRQPVYRSSVGKWRHYEAQLEPVSAILQSAGIDLTGV